MTLEKINNFEADEAFEKAYYKQIFTKLFLFINPYKDDLLSFEEVKELLKPNGQNYLGVITVPLKLIVGSEERYTDFNRAFLPRTKATKGRWVSVSKAYQNSIILPPVSLYKLGGLYFVRDGHHRISVAKLNKVDFIDAEVVELISTIQLNKNSTPAVITDQLLQCEKEWVFKQSGLDHILDMNQLVFTELNGYLLLWQHLINYQKENQTLTFEEATQQWYTMIYLPTAKLIINEGLLKMFPLRTVADLYIWVLDHWQQLKGRYSTIEVRTVVKYLKATQKRDSGFLFKQKN